MNDRELVEKEFTKVLETYQDFVNNIIDGVDVFAGSDFSCYPKSREIEIPYLISDKEANAFLVSVSSANVGNINTNDFQIFIWSILHEIGHLSTKQGDLVSAIGRRISKLLCKLNLITLANKLYFNLPEERKATEWATDYVNLHYQEIKQLEKKLQNAYYNFYDNLGIKI